MPITQSRMLALIQAAQALESALDDLCRDVRTTLSNSPSEADIQQLVFRARPQFIDLNYTDHHTLIALEAKHFSEHARDNQRAAEKQRRRRGRAGTYINPTAPNSLVPTTRTMDRLADYAAQSPSLPQRHYRPKGLDIDTMRQIEEEARAGLDSLGPAPEVGSDPFAGEPETEHFSITPAQPQPQDDK